MAKPGTVAVVNFVGSDNYNLSVSTNGTKASPGARITSWNIQWGDGYSNNGNDYPPSILGHAYEFEGEYKIRLDVSDSKNGHGSDEKPMIVRGPIPIPVPPSNPYGPTTDITCPVGAIAIHAGSTTASRQAQINAAATGASFCIEAGAHDANGINTPKQNQIFCGQYGAVIDGSSWSGSATDDAVFKSNSITGVQIRNLKIQNVPQYAINAFGGASGWTVEHCELTKALFGIGIGPITTVQHNYIHHCDIGDPFNSNPALRGGGYIADSCDQIILYHNEIAFNWPEQKLGSCTNSVFRANYCHNNRLDALWFDTIGTGGLIEDNIVEDNGRAGITAEACIGPVTIRNNQVRRNQQGLYCTISKNTDWYGNTVEYNTASNLEYFVNLDAVNASFDLTNNSFHNNVVRILQADTNFLSIFTLTGSAVSRTPYDNNTKANNYSNNQYHIDNTGAFKFMWSNTGSLNFTSWQAIPQDSGTTLTT